MSGRLGWSGGVGVVMLFVLSGGMGCERLEPAPPPVPPPPRSPPSLDGTGQVRVRVVSEKDQGPLAGAMVALLKGRPSDVTGPLEYALSDGSGVAFFSATPAGEFNLCARGAGHGERCEENVGLVGGGTVSRTLVLPPGGSVRGQVLLPDGSPAVGVRLMAQRGQWFSPSMPSQAVTDVLGNYHLEGMTPGLSDVTLFVPPSFPFLAEGRTALHEVEVEEGETARLDVQLREFVAVVVKPYREGTPGGADRQSESEERVDAVSVSVPLAYWGEGQWGGRVEAGVHQAHVSAFDGMVAFLGRRKVALKPGAPAVIEVGFTKRYVLNGFSGKASPDAPPRFEFSGHVLLPDGSPASGVRIAVQKPREPSYGCGNLPVWYRHIRFDGSAFAVKLLTAQDTVFAWLDNGLAGSVTVSGEKGGRVVADIQLKKTGAIKGRLKVDAETLAYSVPAFMFSDPYLFPLKLVERDGRFIVAGLPPGKDTNLLSEGSASHPYVIQAGVAIDVGELPVQQ